MDIKARIEEVIGQRGLTKREVSERMGKFNQAFNSLITNPKWDTIEHVAQAIGVSVEELLFGRISQEGTIPIINEKRNIGYSQSDSESIGLLICPYCGRGIKLSASTK